MEGRKLCKSCLPMCMPLVPEPSTTYRGERGTRPFLSVANQGQVTYILFPICILLVPEPYTTYRGERGTRPFLSVANQGQVTHVL